MDFYGISCIDYEISGYFNKWNETGTVLPPMLRTARGEKFASHNLFWRVPTIPVARARYICQGDPGTRMNVAALRSHFPTFPYRRPKCIRSGIVLFPPICQL
jgi:hypothetical protein